MSSLNIGIVAHVDAGKTSLTERLLYEQGVISSLGSVDEGNTQTDSLAIERERGITVKAAVTSFRIGDLAVNLLDTPGHPDFIAEVERVLSVLDGAILVLSTVEGVQSQTRILMRTLRRLSIPTLIFVNKIDRMGAQEDPLLESLGEKLGTSIIAMERTHDLGSPKAGVQLFDENEQPFLSDLAQALAERDDDVMADYVAQTNLSYNRLRPALAAQTARALVHPVFFGSARTGAGISELVSGIRELLPAAAGNQGGPLAGSVFKIERNDVGEKVSYVRLFSGLLRVRDRIMIGEDDERVTAIGIFEGGPAVPRTALVAGEIGKVSGLTATRVGDVIGEATSRSAVGSFARPTLETVVTPRHRSDRGALHSALAQLAEQDPLINLRQDDTMREIQLSLYGEVQKEIIAETLATEFGIEVEFRETTAVCIERPVGVGVALERLGDATNPFLATVGLRIEPGAPGTGVVVRLDVKAESIPLYVYKSVDRFERAISEIVADTFHQGIFGWEVTDCTVVMTDCGYNSPGTNSGDFRKLTPLVLMTALKQANTKVFEPIQQFSLELPADALQGLLPVLAKVHATYQSPSITGPLCVLSGQMPAARFYELQQQLPGVAHGEGILESSFDHYRPVAGVPPSRPHIGLNALNREEYLLDVRQRRARSRNVEELK